MGCKAAKSSSVGPKPPLRPGEKPPPSDSEADGSYAAGNAESSVPPNLASMSLCAGDALLTITTCGEAVPDGANEASEDRGGEERLRFDLDGEAREGTRAIGGELREEAEVLLLPSWSVGEASRELSEGVRVE
jgi:hypothetical protein